MGCTRSIPVDERKTKGAPAGGADQDVRIREWPAHSHIKWCYQKCEVDAFVRDTCRDIWDVVLSGNAEPYQDAKKKSGELSPVVFFFNNLYDSLFNLLPAMRGKFKGGMQVKSKMLSHIIQFIFTAPEIGKDFDNLLRKLAVDHNRRGITDPHFSTLGLCVLFAIRKCVGDDFYTPQAKYAITCKFSRVIQVMHPIILRKQTEYEPAWLEAPSTPKAPASPVSTTRVTTSSVTGSSQGKRGSRDQTIEITVEDDPTAPTSGRTHTSLQDSASHSADRSPDSATRRLSNGSIASLTSKNSLSQHSQHSHKPKGPTLPMEMNTAYQPSGSFFAGGQFADKLPTMAAERAPKRPLSTTPEDKQTPSSV